MEIIIRFLIRFLPFAIVRRRYIRSGAQFGDAVSYIYMGECVGFAGLLARWERWEAEFVRRGYRALSIKDFVAIGGYGHTESLESLAKLTPGEQPVRHSLRYREHYLGKARPALDFTSTEPQVGTYVIPDTSVPPPANPPASS